VSQIVNSIFIQYSQLFNYFCLVKGKPKSLNTVTWLSGVLLPPQLLLWDKHKPRPDKGVHGYPQGKPTYLWWTWWWRLQLMMSWRGHSHRPVRIQPGWLAGNCGCVSWNSHKVARAEPQTEPMTFLHKRLSLVTWFSR